MEAGTSVVHFLLSEGTREKKEEGNRRNRKKKKRKRRRNRKKKKRRQQQQQQQLKQQQRATINNEQQSTSSNKIESRMAWLVSALLLCLLALSQALPLLAERGEHTPWQSICTTSAHAPSKGVRLPLLLTFSSFKYRLTVRNLVASMRQAQRTHDQCPHHRASAVDPREDCGPPPLDWAEKLFVLCLDVQMQSWCESQGLNCVPIYRHIPSAQSATQQWTDETFGEVCWRAVVRVLLLLLVLSPPPSSPFLTSSSLLYLPLLVTRTRVC